MKNGNTHIHSWTDERASERAHPGGRSRATFLGKEDVREHLRGHSVKKTTRAVDEQGRPGSAALIDVSARRRLARGPPRNPTAPIAHDEPGEAEVPSSSSLDPWCLSGGCVLGAPRLVGFERRAPASLVCTTPSSRTSLEFSPVSSSPPEHQGVY
mmetsp:Transcript_8383/g.34530  ORF Transcript_8383/g.34530 Transcript_8383/m.34530 type:complete len:155 (+) Transcript_8383:418-882(+)